MAVTVTKQINANDITFTLSGSGSVALNTANTYSDRDLILKILSDDGGGNDVFDANGNLNVPGDIIVGGHSSPIGSTFAADFTPTTSGKGNISNSFVSETGATLTLSEGTWIIKAHAYYRAYTTYNGSTNSSAGARRVRIGYEYTATGTSGTTNGSTNTTYAPAGNVCGVESTIIRSLTQTTKFYPEVYSQNQVGLDNVRIEAVRIA